MVSFVGTVRATNHGKRVVRLEYEAYPEMALRIFEHIASRSDVKIWTGEQILAWYQHCKGRT